MVFAFRIFEFDDFMDYFRRLLLRNLLRQGVKPIIQASATPWVHSVIMETKEHIFLFLPFLAFLVMLIIWFYQESLAEKPRLKNMTAVISFLITIIGIAISLAGILISGTASR